MSTHIYDTRKGRSSGRSSKTAESIVPLTEAERDWVAQHLHLAQELLAELSPVERGKALTPEVLDRLYAYWWSRKSQMEIDPNHVINAVGIAFGQYLVDVCGLQWVAVMKGATGEIAVHGERGDLQLFPPNLVAKRYERGETYVLNEIGRSVADVAQKLQHA
jgi:hypothetical protein